MRDFFKGWRRKAGVVALVMACATATLWIRSRSIQEQLRIPSDNFTQIFVVSSEEGLVCYYLQDIETRKNSLLIRRWYIRPKLPDRYRAEFFTYLDTIDWTVDIAGFYLAESHSEYDTRGIAIIPFWLIACPLTILSTVLLLWPQRKSKK